MAVKRFVCSIFAKHLMTGPMGNSEFCFPSTFNVPLGFTSGNIEGLGETKLTVSLGPVIKCLVTLLGYPGNTGHAVTIYHLYDTIHRKISIPKGF